MSDILNSLKGFPFDQLYCLLLTSIVIWVLAILNKTLIRLERTISNHTFIISQISETLKDFKKGVQS
jgi:hypothetical protein